MTESILECSLCLDFCSDFPGEDYFVTTNCGVASNGFEKSGHTFHIRCLQKTVRPRTEVFNCPICRHENNFTKTLTRLQQIQIVAKPDENVFDYVFKFVVLGKYRAGKTSIVRRFARNVFSEEYNSTDTLDYLVKSIQMAKRRIKLNLWDTAGQEKYRSIVSSYVRDAFGMIFVYDITDRTTFEALEDWIRFANDHGPKETRRILVGNKLDLAYERQVTTKEGEEIAKKFGYKFLEVSAKEARNIAPIFCILTTQILNDPGILQAADKVYNNFRMREEFAKLPFTEKVSLTC